MRVKEMKLGKPIEILVERGGYRFRFVSKIEEINTNKIYISPIASRNRYFKFENTDHIEFIYRDNDRMWKWIGARGSLTTLDGEKIHCLYTTKEGKSYNRRNAYRIFFGIETDVDILIPKTSGEKMEKGTAHGETLKGESLYNAISCKCLVKDVSENGIGIFANEILKNNTEISLSIPSPHGLLQIKAVVVRNSDDHTDIYRYFYGCSIIQSDRLLTKYLFELQREKLKKVRRGKNL